MKKLIAVVIIVLSFSQYTEAQNYGLGNTDPSVFSKYRVPETKLSSLWINTNLSYTENRSEYINPLWQDSKNFQSEFNSSLSPNYIFRHERDDRYLFLNFDINAAHGKQVYENDGVDDRKTDNNKLRINLYGLQRNYFDQSDLFYSLRPEMRFSFEETRTDYSANNYSDPYLGTKTQNYSLSFGIGYGRIRDVTPVVSAIRLQQKLKQLSIINDDLNENAITEIAKQFSRQGYYSSVYNRPDKYFWDDMEKTLNKNNVSIDGINQYGNSYLREIPNEISFIRNEGLIYGIIVRFDYLNSYSSQGYYPSKVIEEFNILGEAYLNFSKQINLNSQLSFDLSLSGGPNIIENAYSKQSYYVNISARYDYELTDRLVVSVEDFLGTNFRNSTYIKRNINNNLNVNFNYFIEDNISLNANASWDYTHRKYSGDQKNITNYKNIMVGFTYYFDRGFIIK